MDSASNNSIRPALSRIAALYGESAVKKFSNSYVAIFGIGGVGGNAAEAIARSGIGEITIVDKDVVEESNINRQTVATHETIGRSKTSVMEERIRRINPSCRVHAIKTFYGFDDTDIDLAKFDYVIDAVDNVSAKLLLIERCAQANVPIICSMGTAGKKDASAFKVTKLSKTSGDGLARVMRRECKKRGLGDVKVIFSEEKPQALEALQDGEHIEQGDIAAIGSAPHVPPVVGLMLAGEVINSLANSRS